MWSTKMTDRHQPPGLHLGYHSGCQHYEPHRHPIYEYDESGETVKGANGMPVRTPQPDRYIVDGTANVTVTVVVDVDPETGERKAVPVVAYTSRIKLESVERDGSLDVSDDDAEFVMGAVPDELEAVIRD
jgi:hypothetical protein